MLREAILTRYNALSCCNLGLFICALLHVSCGNKHTHSSSSHSLTSLLTFSPSQHGLTPHTLCMLSTIELAHNPLNKQKPTSIPLMNRTETGKEVGLLCTKAPPRTGQDGNPWARGRTGMAQGGSALQPLT